MDLIQTISQHTLAFVIVVSILVFVHEFGHYWVAIKNGVKVVSFSIGFGPEIYGWNDKRGTRWKISLLPLGGYVQMFGDSDASSGGVSEEAVTFTEEERKQAFFAKTVGQRAAIVAAGPGINFLFTIVILFGLFVTYGQPSTQPVVQSLSPDMPAIQAGIQEGDRILKVDGEKIRNFNDIVEMMAIGLGKPVDIELQRGDQTLTINVTPKVIEIENNFGMKHVTGRLGILGGRAEFTRLMPMQAIVAAFTDTYDMTKNTLRGLYQIITGERSSRELGGAITIAKLSGDAAGVSIPTLLWFMAMLSANLGLINLFPIPVLDGGHLLFYAAEYVRGKPLSVRMQEYSLRFGLSLVLTLTVFALWNDLSNFGVVAFVTRIFS